MTDADVPQPEKLPLLPKRKKFLIPIVILLAVTLVGSVVGLFIGFGAIKRSEAFKATIAQLEDNLAVKELVGVPFETSAFVLGKQDERNGTYDLTFTISGGYDRAAVRSRCEQEAEGAPWVVTFLDIGVGGREGKVITLVGDPDDPPGGK